MWKQVMFFLFTDLWQIPHFEALPSSVPKNAASPLVDLSQNNNTIPGWSFEGTVLYVTASETIQLPDNGHVVQFRGR